MTTTQDVLFDVVKGAHQSLGIITLNRPQVLNSLNHDMIHAISNHLKHWSRDDEIKAVVIQAVEGRAFCAGGDLRLTYERAKAQNPLMTEFFYDEYQLNRLIHHFKKPYIAFLDGITMGGGVGISLHGSHRVGTDRLLFAMPETGIGFFPDVGGTYFLPRLPNEMGTYLGLTGARITIDDATKLGLVTHKIDAHAWESILQDLLNQPLPLAESKALVTEILNRYAIPVMTSPLMGIQDQISACFQHNSIESMLMAVKFTESEALKNAMQLLRTKSPTSLKVTLRALREGNILDFDDCMRQEFRLTSRFLRSHDFVEGIRAVIIDKDQAPQWEPHDYSAVTDEMVLSYFAPLPKELI